MSHQALVRPRLTQNRRGRHCFPTRLSCFCRPFCPVDNVKSLQMSSRLLALLISAFSRATFCCIQAKRLEISSRSTEALCLRSATVFKLRGKHLRQFCGVIVSENIRIRPSTRIRNVIGFKNFHSGERIQKFPDLLANSPYACGR